MELHLQPLGDDGPALASLFAPADVITGPPWLRAQPTHPSLQARARGKVERC